ncbi:MAG: hypothetical protein HYW25_02745 [Candidatus Aenigmarchaeota archaeon]|nr:hypothetical protein [Candidatus Aenigmarchaeota archaeon]
MEKITDTPQEHGIFKVGQVWEARDDPYCLWKGAAELTAIRRWSDGLWDAEFKAQCEICYVKLSDLTRKDPDTNQPFYRYTGMVS